MWKLNEARKLGGEARRRVEGRSGGKPRQVARRIAFRQEEGFHGPPPAAVQFPDRNVRKASVGRSLRPGQRLARISAAGVHPGEDRRRRSWRRCSAWPRIRWTLPRTCPRPRSTWSAPSSSRPLTNSGRTSSPIADDWTLYTHAQHRRSRTDPTGRPAPDDVSGDEQSRTSRRPGGRRSMTTPD